MRPCRDLERGLEHRLAIHDAAPNEQRRLHRGRRHIGQRRGADEVRHHADIRVVADPLEVAVPHDVRVELRRLERVRRDVVSVRSDESAQIALKPILERRVDRAGLDA